MFVILMCMSCTVQLKVRLLLKARPYLIPRWGPKLHIEQLLPEQAVLLATFNDWLSPGATYCLFIYLFIYLFIIFLSQKKEIKIHVQI